MSKVETCCGCCSLRSGAIITGVLGFVAAILTLLTILLKKEAEDTATQTPGSTAKVAICITLLLTACLAVMLILGTIKKNTYLIVPWLVLTAISLLCTLIYSVWFVVVSLIAQNNLAAFVCLFTVFPAMGLYVYLWIIVLSFFQTIRDDN